MSSRNQFVRQTAAMLLACGLIASVLPGLAAAQDLSTREKRSAWVIAQSRSDDVAPNGKFAASTALARLELNPDDAEVIDRITHFYDRVPAGSNGQQFSYPGVAWVLGKYWDKFTPAQRDHLKAKLRDFSDLLGHGTENHAVMKCVAAHIFAQNWPNDTGWVRGQYSSQQVLQATRARILNVVNGYYDKNHEEWISENYMGINLFPFHALYDCATDPEIKHAAYAALCYHYASLAANSYRGLHISPFPRGRLAPQTVPGPGTTFLTWLHSGPDYTERVPATDGSNFRGDAAAICTYVATSDFVMPPAILSVWRGEMGPYELTSSAAGFGHHGTTTGFWGTGEPGATNRYIYRHPDYAIGSGFLEYYPDEFYVQHHSNVSILYRSTDEWSFIETHHPYWRSNTLEWAYGNNSPFIQTAQYKSAAIAIFNIPKTDPWAGRGRGEWQAARDQHFDNLIQEAYVRYPKSIDEVIDEHGWVFLREGSVYAAIRPLKTYTIDANYVPATADFNTIRSAFAQTGFVYDVATQAEYASFAAFRAAATQNPPTIDWDNLSVTYTSLAGDTITATWNPPNYSGPPQTKWVWEGGSSIADLEPQVVWRSDRAGGGREWSWDAENRQWIGPAGDAWYPGSRVRVRPDITVNGAVVPVDTTYPVLKSSSVELIDRVLRVQAPADQLEIDWRGKVTRFSQQPKAPPAAAKPTSYLPLMESHLGKLITSGLDEYGPKQTAMWMAVIDTRTGRHPEFSHTPKRVYRLIGAPRGSALYWDQPLIVAACRLSEITGNPDYALAVNRYLDDFLAACVASNGLFQWGNHCYYDAYEDKLVTFSGGYHELRPHAPAWDLFWQRAPERTECYLRTMAARHIYDSETGGFNRHDDGRRGHAFLEAGGVIVESLAWLYSKTQDPELLETALRVARYTYRHRGESTGLVRNEPDMGRWDAKVCTTEVAVWANSLMRASDLTDNGEFQQMAHEAVAAYLKYGYDESAEHYYGQLSVADAQPVVPEAVGHWPRKYSNIWNADQWPTHDYPMAMAEACLTLYDRTNKPLFREAVYRWAEIVCHSPRQDRPRAYADQYGQCIRFLVRAAGRMNEDRWLATASRLAEEAVERLYDNGWFQSFPESHIHEAVGGVGELFQALILLENVALSQRDRSADENGQDGS